MTDIRERLQSLLTRLERIWRVYREAGPGNVDADLFEDVHALAESVLPELAEAAAGDDLLEAIQTAVDLGRRCAERPEGLCFITGEAGLVPRRDLHQKFDSALATMSAALATSPP
jgi:hypothetical protein